MRFKTSKQIFAHLDCDSFFASCEILRNPSIKDDFVIVGDEIVIACNYKTKALGISTGTAIWEAKRILKGRGVYIKGDHLFYEEVSEKLMEYLTVNTLSIEPFSIDEAFCEITGLAEMYNLSLEDYILFLQHDILDKIGIPVSIGVSTTRIKSKIFSKINKPFGFFIDNGNSSEIYKDLPLKIIPFIGKSSQEILKYKSKTIYDFIQLGYRGVKNLLGKSGTDLWLELMGVNAFRVRKNQDNKSISRSRSFNKNMTNNKDFLYKELLKNFEWLFDEMLAKNYQTRKIIVFLRTKSFEILAYKMDLFEHTSSRAKLFKVSKELFYDNFNDTIIYRSTGIIFTNLRKIENVQLNIFDDINKQKYSQNSNAILQKTISELNNKYQNHKVTYGLTIMNKKKSEKLSIVC